MRALADFRLARYEFVLRLEEPAYLPPYKGSTIRGGLAWGVKNVSCTLPHGTCRDCPAGSGCAYAYIFETTPGQDAEVLRRYLDIPRPYVIEPLDGGCRSYKAGDELAFGVLLFGRGIHLFPFLVMGCRQWGRHGIGVGRAKFVLASVSEVNPVNGERRCLYRQGSQMEGAAVSVSGSDLLQVMPPLPDQIQVSFLTPLRIKTQGELVREPGFAVLMREALIRLSTLSYFHCGARIDLPYRELIDAAAAVETCRAKIEWADLERYSNRQKTRLKISGFTGLATYKGPLAPFLPYIWLGQYIHLGKGTVMGLGQIEVQTTGGDSQ